jgi:hypothetical protein
MIYCVVPDELEPDLLERLTAYYADDPNVEVIIERRHSERRSVLEGSADVAAHRRERRDRRRSRVPGEFPSLETA